MCWTTAPTNLMICNLYKYDVPFKSLLLSFVYSGQEETVRLKIVKNTNSSLFTTSIWNRNFFAHLPLSKLRLNCTYMKCILSYSESKKCILFCCLKPFRSIHPTGWHNILRVFKYPCNIRVFILYTYIYILYLVQLFLVQVHQHAY